MLQRPKNFIENRGEMLQRSDISKKFTADSRKWSSAESYYTIRWTVALTALCDVLLFWDELFYYESFGLFAVLILVQLAATGAAAFRIYNKQKKD